MENNAEIFEQEPTKMDAQVTIEQKTAFYKKEANLADPKTFTSLVNALRVEPSPSKSALTKTSHARRYPVQNDIKQVMGEVKRFIKSPVKYVEEGPYLKEIIAYQIHKKTSHIKDPEERALAKEMMREQLSAALSYKNIKALIFAQYLEKYTSLARKGEMGFLKYLRAAYKFVKSGDAFFVVLEKNSKTSPRQYQSMLESKAHYELLNFVIKQEKNSFISTRETNKEEETTNIQTNLLGST